MAAGGRRSPGSQPEDRRCMMSAISVTVQENWRLAGLSILSKPNSEFGTVKFVNLD